MSTPLPSSDPADLPNLARCFSACVPPGEQTALRNYLTANIAAVATNPVCTAPSAPTGVSASNARVADPTTQMNVRWNQPANSGSFITGYVIKWGTVSGVYTNSMNVPLTPKNFTVTGLTPGTTYFFVVQAFAFAGCVSANSNEASNSTSSGSGPSGSCGAGNTFAIAWAARVVANGGASPSVATQTAIANFQCGLITDGLDTLMISWNAFVPDNLTAARTPQLLGGGNDPWTNIGPFVAGDLTVNGLIGDGATKALDTGLIPVFIFANTIDVGLSFYAFTNNNLANAVVMGCDNGAFTQFLLTGNNDTQSFFYAWDLASGVAVNQMGFTGYNSGNRTAVNVSNLYQANSGTPHHTLGSSAVNTTGALTAAFSIHVFCFTNNVGNANFTNQRLSFVAIHHGLTSAQSALFFARIDALRIALGGGRV